MGHYSHSRNKGKKVDIAKIQEDPTFVQQRRYENKMWKGGNPTALRSRLLDKLFSHPYISPFASHCIKLHESETKQRGGRNEKKEFWEQKKGEEEEEEEQRKEVSGGGLISFSKCQIAFHFLFY